MSSSIPFLDGEGGGGGGAEVVQRRWRRRAIGIDAEEAKRQMHFAVPMTLTNMSYYAIPLISVMFAGHLGELELASSTLANSWSAVTCFALMVYLYLSTGNYY